MIVVLRLGRGAIVDEIEHEVLRADSLGSKSHNRQYDDRFEMLAKFREGDSAGSSARIARGQ